MEDNALNANGVHQIQIHVLLYITRTPRITFIQYIVFYLHSPSTQ